MVFSKGRNNNNISTPLVKLSRWDRKNSAIVSIFRNKKKLFTLNRHICGSFSCKPYVSGTRIGQSLFTSNLPEKYWFSDLPGNFVVLKFLSRYSIFSNIHINNKRKYSLSNGTFCQIIDFFLEFNLLKVVLPSKRTKLISGWNFVILGRNAQQDYRFGVLGKAGVRLFNGKKPKVRGVARNPVDHPHGGRTKTNQPEVSIWGWIAKRNK